MPVAASKVGVFPHQCRNAATTFVVRNHASMNGCLADKAVTTVDRNCVAIVGIRASNHQVCIPQGLIADGVVFEQMSGFTIRRTAESHMCRGERTTVIAVETALIAVTPKAGAAPDVAGLPVAFDITSC